MIVVLARYDVAQRNFGADLPAGAEPPLEQGESIILDATTGRAIEITGFGPAGPDAHTPNPAALGTPTVVLAD